MLIDGPPPHGGDIFAAARTLGVGAQEMIDFSANINPFGFPAGIRDALVTGLEMIRHYPDPSCTDLRLDLGQYHDLAPERIIVGNGSTELIYLVARALKPKRAMIVCPAFSEYEKALRMAGTETVHLHTAETDGFTLRAAPDSGACDMVVLANPANPSGALLSRSQMFSIVEALVRRHVLVFLDEAFVDFVEEASLKKALDRFPRLVILRSFTKFFGIPGIRLGYLLAAAKIIEVLQDCREPWSVSTPAQLAGRACLEDRSFIERTRSMLPVHREKLSERLAHINGLRVFPGSANYLLLKLTMPGWNASLLRIKMAAQRILIRDASNFQGLDGRFFRVAVRLKEENDRLVAALQRSLTEEAHVPEPGYLISACGHH